MFLVALDIPGLQIAAHQVVLERRGEAETYHGVQFE